MDIDDILYDLVHDYPGGSGGMAQRVGDNKNTLQLRVDRNIKTHHVPVKLAAKIADAANSDDVAKWFAARRNGIFLRVTQHEGTSDTDLLSLIIKANKEQADLFVCIQQAWADGVIDPGDASSIKRESYEHLAAIAELINRVDGMVQERRKVARVK